MEHKDLLAQFGVYTSRAPRYTSYPTAAQFTPSIGAEFFVSEISNLPTDKPVSIYIHIPFCERLCWFCACRTQGTKTSAPVAVYLESLKREIELLAKQLPGGHKMARLHWGGGTPTILTPAMIDDLAQHIFDSLTPTDDFEFSVEIDPTLVDAAKISSLKAAGMTRASIGVQDFAQPVQSAIGRDQSVAQTQACVALLRDHGIAGLNMDILYGLPRQTTHSVLETMANVTEIGPDRIALYGYAHVPWMAKRQQMIDESALPGGPQRRALFALMSSALEQSGMTPVGIDHFAKPADSLALAAKTKTMRRNFQGYTTDCCETLIGLGASSISKLPGGYAQNAPASSQYMRQIGTGGFATQRGVTLSESDKLRARVIEMIMCDFELRLDELEARFSGIFTEIVDDLALVCDHFADALDTSSDGFRIIQHKRALARLIAQQFDRYTDDKAKYSMVS